MLWHGRQYGCGSWLPENKKDNMCLSPFPLTVESLDCFEKIYFDLFHILLNSVQKQSYYLIIQKLRTHIGENDFFKYKNSELAVFN